MTKSDGTSVNKAGSHFAKARGMSGRIGLADVRASQNLTQVSLPLVMRFVFVPIAWPLTVAAARLGMLPNQVTALRVVLIAAGMIGIAYPNSTALAVGLVLYLLAVVADSVDGNLSRLRNKATYFGKYFDGIVDMMADLLFPLSLGTHLSLSGDRSPTQVLLGGAATLALSLVFLLIHRFSMFKLLLEKNCGQAGGAAKPKLKAFLESPIGRRLLAFDSHGMNFVFDFRYLGLATALCLDQLSTYLTLLTVVYATAALLFLVSRISQGYAVLNVHRRSRSAAA